MRFQKAHQGFPGPMRVDGPVADQPVRPRTPPGVGTPLRADELPGQRHPSSHTGQIEGDKKAGADRGAELSRVLAEPPR